MATVYARTWISALGVQAGTVLQVEDTDRLIVAALAAGWLQLVAAPTTPVPVYADSIDRAELDAARAELKSAFVPGRVLNSNGTVNAQKKVTVKLTADGTDIEDLIIETVA